MTLFTSRIQLFSGVVSFLGHVYFACQIQAFKTRSSKVFGCLTPLSHYFKLDLSLKIPFERFGTSTFYKKKMGQSNKVENE